MQLNKERIQLLVDALESGKFIQGFLNLEENLPDMDSISPIHNSGMAIQLLHAMIV